MHTRTIFAQERPKKSLLDEFREFVVNRTTPKGRIDDLLTPYTKAYFAAKGQNLLVLPFCCGLVKLCLNVLGCFFCTDIAAVDAGFETPRRAARLKKVTRSPSFSAYAAPAA